MTSFFCRENAGRALIMQYNALILAEIPTEVSRSATANNLTDSQHHVLFYGEGLVRRLAGNQYPSLKLLKSEVALRSTGSSR